MTPALQSAELYCYVHMLFFVFLISSSTISITSLGKDHITDCLNTEDFLFFPNIFEFQNYSFF